MEYGKGFKNLETSKEKKIKVNCNHKHKIKQNKNNTHKRYITGIIPITGMKFSRITSSKITFPELTGGQIIMRIRDLVIDPLNLYISLNSLI